MQLLITQFSPTSCHFLSSKSEMFFSAPRPQTNRCSVLLVVKKYCARGADWIHLAQNKVQWRFLVNTAMNVKFQVLTAASVKITVFWDAVPCSLAVC
jgi:hypothetical protein